MVQKGCPEKFSSEKGILWTVTSCPIRMEVRVKPKREGDDLLAGRHLSLLETFPNLKIYPLGRREAEAAAGLRARYPAIRVPDAIQLGITLAHRAQAFITNDPHFKAVGSEIEVVVVEEVFSLDTVRNSRYIRTLKLGRLPTLGGGSSPEKVFEGRALR